MKKVLILSCSTGQGHNSCAQAVEDHFTGEGVACVRKDALDFISPAFSRFISWGHSWVYRHLPGLFRWGYRFSEKHPGVFRNGSAASRLLASGAEDLYAHIQAEGYDTVVCTHVFAGIMLTHMRRRHAMALQTAFVATDYTCSPGVADGDMDHYFIPDEALREEFLRCGVPAERITPSGIPLRRQFEKQTEKADAKRLLGLRAEKLHLLVMCGSMGCVHGPHGAGAV